MKKMLLVALMGVVCTSGLRAGTMDDVMALKTSAEDGISSFNDATDIGQLDSKVAELKDKLVFKGVKIAYANYKDSTEYKALGFMDKGKVKIAREAYVQAGVDDLIAQGRNIAEANIDAAKEAAGGYAEGVMEKAEGTMEQAEVITPDFGG